MGVRLGLRDSFSTSLTLSASTLECNKLDLDGETLLGVPYTFTDEGGNTCGCGGETWACKVLSTALAAPPPID